MYSKYTDATQRELNIPPNYGGSIFGRRNANIHFTPDRTPPPTREEPFASPSKNENRAEEATASPSAEQTIAYDDSQEEEAKASAPVSLFSPLGALGTEEILLIALALIIFQSGKEPELALILLALLFIS
jgi:hypothetical protein